MVTKTGIWITILAMVIAGLLLLIPSQPAIIVSAQPKIPEGWIEIISERTRVGKKYTNISNPSQEAITTGLATIHYESIMDTGIYDSECDFSPQRINNAQLDGWRVTQCGWHYALGQPSGKTTDGWVGFGSRQGSNWIMFRLSRVGYLHWPSRNWEDIGGNPTYDRLDLISEVGQTEYGHGNMVNVSATTTWSNIWTTPDNGALNITWQASGDRLKEEIIVNQQAREWLQTSRPPSTPASETWFGFVLQVDWTDIPKIIKDGLEQNINGDWNVTNTSVELRDNLDRLLAFMPISEVIVRDDFNETREPLTKRFWLDGDGNHYVLIGIRVPELVSMPVGDLVFDPTIDEQVGASADDGSSRVLSGQFWPVKDDMNIGLSTNPLDSWGRFTTVSIPQGSPILSASIGATAKDSSFDGVGVKSNIYLNYVDDAVAPMDENDHEAKARTTAFTAWNDEDLVLDVEIPSPDISSAMQEVINRVGWSSGNALMILWDDNVSSAGMQYLPWQYDGSTTKALKLDVEWGWENSPPTITNKISTDNGEINTEYSRSFAATDVDSNQTLIWTLVTNASFLSVDSLNRTVYVNGTLPSTEGSYYVNVTVADQGVPINLTDYVNYTLNVIEIPTALTHSEWIQIILIGVMFMFLTALAFAHEHAWPLFFVAGLIGIVYGVWLTGFLIAPLLGLTFIFPGVIVMLYGGFRLKEVF